jgi:hypothetical protein
MYPVIQMEIKPVGIEKKLIVSDGIKIATTKLPVTAASQNDIGHLTRQ